MAKKLFVGGLSYNTTEETLKENFSKAGVVESANVIVDKMSNRSKGFGFVEMSSEEEAQEAIKMFNGKEIDGRSVTVSEARPMEERPRRDGFRRDSRGGGDRRDSRGGDRRGGFGNRRNDSNW
jgi:RNA recognition motif-containing protein